MKVRLQKVLADAGVASRRGAEQLMLEGRVRVNGEVVRKLGSVIDPQADRVNVDGRPVRAKRKLCIALNKPKGCVCTRHDPEKRRTVLDLVPSEWGSLYPVGRLDYDTEGLLFLTNDGELCLRLTHPRYRVSKRYIATVEGGVAPGTLHPLTRGVIHQGERLKAERLRIVHSSKAQTVVELELFEGKNREVRRLFESQGLTVRGLRRTQVGPIRLGELPAGRWRVLSEREIESLRESGAGSSGHSRGAPPGRAAAGAAEPGRPETERLEGTHGPPG